MKYNTPISILLVAGVLTRHFFCTKHQSPSTKLQATTPKIPLNRGVVADRGVIAHSLNGMYNCCISNVNRNIAKSNRYNANVNRNTANVYRYNGSAMPYNAIVRRNIVNVFKNTALYLNTLAL